MIPEQTNQEPQAAEGQAQLEEGGCRAADQGSQARCGDVEVNQAPATPVAVAIFAWNEEAGIRATLESLFQQSLFRELSQRHQHCRVLCVVNGCTDRTPLVAAEVFEAQKRHHPYRESFSCQVFNLAERGKLNAWNQFVRVLAPRQAPFLFLMDADILIHRPDTLWNMLRVLETNPDASVAVDRPCKDIEFKSHRSLRERLSLAASRSTLSAQAQLCGQLYCIRAAVARRIYLPKDLAACEDGFIKTLVCTDFLAHEVWPQRIRLAEGAEHTFEAYTSLRAILKNQKRQIIGQTIVHLLVDTHLQQLSPAAREHLAELLLERDQTDPGWLKRLIRQHLEGVRFFWRLYPGLLGLRFRRLKSLSPLRQLAGFPAATLGSLMALAGSWLAYRTLKSGCTDYWPQAKRLGLKADSAGQLGDWSLSATQVLGRDGTRPCPNQQE
ncbi:MAG TPA: glycosyltransferase, partial [Candidatus Sulfotelmatobacter sp.]|nr:glycosyltransferase [Candidatus Sulfotelmatobacter sp.]